jgi:Replication-relaxation
MSTNRAGGRDRVVRPRRSSDLNTAALAPIDRRLLDILCAHRVVTQDQLHRLFPDVPERTLRYRTRRLHDLGLAGRSRPYRERGSAPNHHWPTRRADCLMRGEPAPRGGERKEPNPIFLAHAAALTDLYVALSVKGEAAGLTLQEYRREGDAREPFTHDVKERALAPDAMMILIDPHGGKLGAFVEIDRGTMSHTRLCAKAELYAAYAATDAWHGHHPFLPALLFLTTTDLRAAKFLKALARSLTHGPRHNRRRHALIAGAGGIAWTPGRLLTTACLADLDGNTGLTLLDLLTAARAPYDETLARRHEQELAEAEKRRRLQTNPEAMRQFLNGHSRDLQPYLQDLGPVGERTIEQLTASIGEPSPDEDAVLLAIARDLDQCLPEPWRHELPSPSVDARSEITRLAKHYRRHQAKQLTTLLDRHGDGPSLRRARRALREQGPLTVDAIRRLPQDAERDETARHEQDERRLAYLQWREQTARQLARRAGPLGRLTHHPEDFYPQLDHERLRTCGECTETIYPSATQAGSYGQRTVPACHYCGESQDTKPYEPTPSKESEAYR